MVASTHRSLSRSCNPSWPTVLQLPQLYYYYIIELQLAELLQLSALHQNLRIYIASQSLSGDPVSLVPFPFLPLIYAYSAAITLKDITQTNHNITSHFLKTKNLSRYNLLQYLSAKLTRTIQGSNTPRTSMYTMYTISTQRIRHNGPKMV